MKSPGFVPASGGRVAVLEQFAMAGGLPNLATLQLELFQKSAALAAADDGLPDPATGAHLNSGMGIDLSHDGILMILDKAVGFMMLYDYVMLKFV